MDAGYLLEILIIKMIMMINYHLLISSLELWGFTFPRLIYYEVYLLLLFVIFFYIVCVLFFIQYVDFKTFSGGLACTRAPKANRLISFKCQIVLKRNVTWWTLFICYVCINY